MITPSFSLTATERVLPRLALDFTTASLDPRVTFTRALNTATVVNSSGYIVGINANLPRFDYDPIALTCKGLLIEESRTNLFDASADFQGAGNWKYVLGVLNTSAVVGPDGVTTVRKLVMNNGASPTFAGNSGVYNVLSLTNGTSYTYSVFAKSGEFNVIRFRDSYVSGNFLDINLDTGVITNGTAIYTNVSANLYANGFRRIQFTFVFPGATGAVASPAYRADSTGDGTSGFYVFGGQLEAGGFATSYIPTTTASVLRNADVATMTGTNFSDWYTGGTSGTMVAQATPPNASQSFAAVLAFAGASPSTDFIYLGRSGTSARAFVTVSSVGQGTFNFGTWANGTAGKTSIAYAPSNVAPCFNAGTVTVNTTASVPTLVRAYIGNFSDGGSTVWNGIVSKVFYYSQRLTNAEIQAFTK
jgi:hypothetical protein